MNGGEEMRRDANQQVVKTNMAATFKTRLFEQKCRYKANSIQKVQSCTFLPPDLSPNKQTCPLEYHADSGYLWEVVQVTFKKAGKMLEMCPSDIFTLQIIKKKRQSGCWEVQYLWVLPVRLHEVKNTSAKTYKTRNQVNQEWGGFNLPQQV